MRRRRGDPGSAYHVSPSPRSLVPLRPLFTPSLVSYEDRRLFHPAGLNRPAFAFERAARRLVAKATPMDSLSARVGFAVPKKVAVCVRRKQRKEVLHAFDFHGKGAGGVRRVRRRGPFSDVDC